jgi:hypothetical protein
VFVVSPGEYADYRRVRLAETADERLASAWRYLEEHPEGQYAGRLRRFFDKAEPAFYEVRRRSPAGLESYLAALPDGPHAEEALQALVDARFAAAAPSLDTVAAQRTSLRIRRENEARDKAADELRWWLVHLLDPTLWRAPFDEGPGDLVVRYRLSLPAPLCGGHLEFVAGQQCVKTFTRSFVVRGDDGREERELTYEVEIELDDRWHLHRAKLVGIGMFVAVEEARQGKSLVMLATEEIAAIARRALDELPMSLSEDDRLCTGGGKGDGRWIFDCEGVELVAEPGLEGGADVLTFRRSGSEAPSSESGDPRSESESESDS